MSYEPTNWKDGDLVTSAKLNKMEQGIADGSGIFVVNISATGELPTVTQTMDKTWRQILNATFPIAKLAENGAVGYSYILSVYSLEGEEYIIDVSDGNGSSISFKTDSENGYPTYTRGVAPLDGN